MIASKVIGWGAGIVIVALLACIASLHVDISELQSELETAKSDLATANASKIILKSTIEEQNRRIRVAEDQANQMRANQVAALTEADIIVATYEERIEKVRKEKATTAEEVRIKMLKFAGVHL